MVNFRTDSIRQSTQPLQKYSKAYDKDANHQYVSERIYKDKSMLCRIAIPYIYEQSNISTSDENKRQKKPKITKKIPKYDLPYKNNKPFKPMYNYEKTPINQYLSYELSEQINVGLKQVKILSDQIKYIKEQKKKQTAIQEKKVFKNIRIRPTKFKHNKWKFSASATQLR